MMRVSSLYLCEGGELYLLIRSLSERDKVSYNSKALRIGWASHLYSNEYVVLACRGWAFWHGWPQGSL